MQTLPGKEAGLPCTQISSPELLLLCSSALLFSSDSLSQIPGSSKWKGLGWAKEKEQDTSATVLDMDAEVLDQYQKQGDTAF